MWFFMYIKGVRERERERERDLRQYNGSQLDSVTITLQALR
jgi:hypothetical protein